MDNQKVGIRLLGPAQTMVGGKPVPASLHRKALALLAYLAAEPQPHRREFLGFLLWPGLPGHSARANLRKTVFKLRSAIGCETFPRVTADSVGLDPGDFTFDLAEFATPPGPDATIEELERQAALYRGPFLDGLELEDCPDFADWLSARREACRRGALALFDRLGDALERAGHAERLLAVAGAQLELEPWNEDAHRRIMRVLAGRGQLAAAVAQFETCRQALWREQAAEPAAETRELLALIQAGRLGKPPAAPREVAERRQVTALCCRLAPAKAINPEDIVEQWLEQHRNVQDIVREHGGHVAPGHGGTLFGYFGYPAAQEDAARRAVRAALAAQQLGDARLALRCGVNTGMVVASDSLPDSLGLTSATALRLSEIGDGTVIGDATLQLVDGYFDCEPVGLGAHRVLGESGARHRLDAASRLTPYVGRVAEVGVLAEQWAAARRRGLRAALVRGAAGIGKSRLVRVLAEQLALDAQATREMRCFPEFAQSPFHPVRAMLEAICGFEPADSPERKTQKLARHYESHFAGLARQAVPLLLALLSLPVPAGHAKRPPAGARQKEQTVEVLLDLLCAVAARRPLLLVVEDLHWADASTLDLLARLVQRRGSAPILALFTARPEFDPAWRSALDADIELAPLSREEAAIMAASLNPAAAPAAHEGIVERSGGIPLFVEEMAKLVHGGSARVPATLHDLLAAELDALGDAKRTAQLAATIGRRFDAALLLAVSESPPMLDALLRAGLVLEVRGGYKFKHALIQEAAYESQTRAGRQTAHRRIAEELQARGAGEPEVLAQHWAACGETRQAIERWLEAGKRATQHAATAEAVAHFRAGLALIPSLAPGIERDRLEFALQAGLGVVLQAAHGYGSELATQANARAAELGAVISDHEELFRAQWAQVMNAIAGVGSHAALEPAERLLETARSRGGPLERQAAHYAMADAAFWAGRFTAAREHVEHALALYHPAQHRSLLEQFGEDLSVSCMAYQAWSTFFLGYPDTAQHVAREMLERARKLAHPHTLALALCFASVLHRWLDKPLETLKLSEETISVSREHGFPVWLAAGEMTHGWALVKQGRRDQGIAELNSSIDGMRAAIRGISVVFLSALVEAYLHAGMAAAALESAEEALAEAAATTDGHFTAEVHRLRGECRLRLSPLSHAEAKEDFLRALALGRRQGARTLELRAGMSLAAHFGEKQWLAGVRESFTEGFKTPHLVQADGLLGARGR
ncbi:MAG TPA: AAA family ATPase [Rhodocyclaceae bacterium]